MGQQQSFPISSTTHSAGPKQQSENGLAWDRSSTRRTAWCDISGRFCDPRECLAAYLALESAEVIAGVKPANLISLQNRAHACGSNLYQYWQQWGEEVTCAARLESFPLIDRGNSVLVLLYQPTALAEHLSTPAVRAMLRRAGYPDDVNVHSLLEELANRMAHGGFPHEIGILLGYPLKDVAGFMGLARIPFTCQGPWKIYGDPIASLRLADTFRWCRSRMAEGLATCSSPYDCFGTSTVDALFFCCSDDNDYHLQCVPRAVSAAPIHSTEEATLCR